MKIEGNLQKIKVAMVILFAVSAMLIMPVEVRAADLPTVIIGEIKYEVDEENQTASVKTYEKGSDAAYKEIIIPSKILYKQREYAVTEIGYNAFYNAAYLEKITISDGVVSIEESAFFKCAIKEIEIPNGVVSIGENAFYGCENLKKIEIPDSVTSIGKSCFYTCRSLEEIVLPKNLTVLSHGMFIGCESLKKITFPENLIEIQGEAFVRCISLKQITLPKSLKVIGRYGAFVNCDALEQLVIPEGVESVDGGCINGCDNLKRIFYPEKFKQNFIGSPMDMVAQVSYVINEDGTASLTVERLPGGMTEISLPSDIGGRKITSIIGPEGVELSVSCTNHYTKTYTKSVDGHQYTCVVCKKDIKEAHSYEGGAQACVCGYIPFAIVAQPKGISLSYGKSANLSVTVKATLGKEKIAYQWMENGSAIAGATASSYKIPKRKPVGSYTYTCKVACGGYSKVTTAAVVTIQAPAKGKKYKDDTNMATYKVTKARIDGKGTVEYVKPVNKKKSTVIIPATVKIGGVTYKVTSIAKNAFKNNKYIKRLTIEKNVEKIGARAFYGCKKLKNITIKTTKLKAKKIGTAAFKKTPSNAKIKVPKKKLKAYKTMLLKKGVNKKAKIRKM